MKDHQTTYLYKANHEAFKNCLPLQGASQESENVNIRLNEAR